jgi:hypothetical protein
MTEYRLRLVRFISEWSQESFQKKKPESIKRVLDKHIIFATITKDEDAELNKAGLRSKLRKEAIDGGKLVSDVFERYKTVKISLEHVGHTIDAKRIIRK